MKYRTLLAGTHHNAVDDLFSNMEQMECITTSLRPKDIIRHLQIFTPDIFVVCIQNKGRELANIMLKIENELKRMDTVFVLLGEKGDVNEFKFVAPDLADISLVRPLTNTKIVEQIDEFILKREQERELRAKQAELSEEAVAKKHILVVDDDPNMLKLLKTQLEDHYNVATAINGSLALRFLKKKSTDLILLDYEMPGQSGEQVLSILRRNEDWKDIPVVFLTGVDEAEKITKVMALRPQGYLLKPVDYSKLLETVKHAIGE